MTVRVAGAVVPAAWLLGDGQGDAHARWAAVQWAGAGCLAACSHWVVGTLHLHKKYDSAITAPVRLCSRQQTALPGTAAAGLPL